MRLKFTESLWLGLGLGLQGRKSALTSAQPPRVSRYHPAQEMTGQLDGVSGFACLSCLLPRLSLSPAEKA